MSTNKQIKNHNCKYKSLSVHKNTIEKRRKKELCQEISRVGSKMCKDNDIRAYALVGIDSKGNSHAIWDTGNILPMWAFSDTIAGMLRRDIEESGVTEQWVPPITSN